jgi:hypothetical protein
MFGKVFPGFAAVLVVGTAAILPFDAFAGGIHGGFHGGFHNGGAFHHGAFHHGGFRIVDGHGGLHRGVFSRRTDQRWAAHQRGEFRGGSSSGASGYGGSISGTGVGGQISMTSTSSGASGNAFSNSSNYSTGPGHKINGCYRLGCCATYCPND